MKKLNCWAVALGAVISIPTNAMALIGDSIHAASIINGLRRVPVGTWRFTLEQSVADGFDAACVYSVRWSNNAVEPSDASLTVEELATSGNMDCEKNALSPFSTSVQLRRRGVNTGFDSRLQKHRISQLQLGEDGGSGVLNGIIQFHPASVPYSISLTPM
ncbi:hypothetical protein WME79_11780 [Sorangium sp. So ce726]|uniref:hypothetical protein n=1 Tax=Sorangium sp. So ce726 TaxID=3133319 RepID=UPI003F61CEE9